ncbi:N-acetyltransferase family protein [Propionibacteriaceae bacterium Y1685]|uniref:GNAT family N-acetyltransferase n=1 Tax=Microlunatus sp. Y1700 TaxID=3418487 RepID=UPI003B78FA63
MTLATLSLADHSTIRLLRACQSDVPEIVRMLADDSIARSRGDNDAEQDAAAYQRAFALIDADPAQLLVIGRTADDQPAATCQLTLIPGLSRVGSTRLQIEAVRVAESQRGSGLGTALINWALDEGRRRGATLAQLTSDGERTDARRFYERLGFVASHVGFKYAL